MTYLTTQESADRLRMCKKSLLKTDIPRVRKSSRKLLWREEDLDNWARSRLEYGEDVSAGPISSRGGQRIMRMKQRGTPKVFTPEELKKITVVEVGRE